MTDTQTIFDDILQKTNARRTGQDGQYVGLCPSHEDTNPSLGETITSDGKILLNCYAGCATEAVVSALDYAMSDLSPRSNGHKSNGQTRPKSSTVATYDYRDESGELLYQAVRKEPKQFLQRRPDGHGEWIWSVKDVPRRVLYHLSEVLGAEHVYVCEGEKSADAVRALGVVATTNVGGADKWRSEYSESLRGKHVVILPDQDNAGMQHSNSVSHSLYGKAASIKVLSLPGLEYRDKHGDDPADWTQRGGTLDELRELAEGTHEWTPKTDADQADNPTGKPKTDDYLKALAALGYTFQIDERNDQVLVNGAPHSDALAAKLRTQMRDLGFNAMSHVEDAYLAHAYDNPYHPVKHYLESLAWDGKDVIADLAGHFAYDKGDLPAFLRRWLIGAVAKAYTGAQNRMLVLDGDQDAGKSHFVKWLCSPLLNLYVEAAINPENKDDMLRLINSWVWEVGELGSTTRKADREALKQFLTLQQVTVRPPYGRRDLVKPALASFIGTVNDEGGVLSDPTGSRRYMTVHLTGINWDYTKLDINQVWAQAKALYDAGESWKLEGDELATAKAVNDEYEIDDPLAGYLLRVVELTYKPDDFMPTCDILDRLHLTGWRMTSPKAESMAVASVMRKLKVDKAKIDDVRGWLGVKAKPIQTT